MCGIAGFLGPPRGDESEVAAALALALAHRGPDDEGTKGLGVGRDRRLSLVHRRLSILDLSPLGHQPMHDPVTGNWVVFNGEIYNFENLKAQLISQGEVFQSRSDTEVLLRTYARYGLGALDRLQGMFAFALWDAAHQKLVLAVDPLGIKPLYWSLAKDGTFSFASEVQALLAAGLVGRRIGLMGMASYLSYGSVQGPATIIEGVQGIQAGCYLAVAAAGEIQGPRQYWSPGFTQQGCGRSPTPETARELGDLLRRVTKEHLISDVPVALFLSGGVDSTALASFAAPSAPGLKAFSVGFKEVSWSEIEYSKATARRLNLDHEQLVLTPDELLLRLPEALDATDQPSVDGTNVFVLSRLVREAGVKVALSGQGGDELFGGYSTFRHVEAAIKWRERLSIVPGWAWRAGAVGWNRARRNFRALPDKLGQFMANGGGVLETYLLLRQMLPPANVDQLFPSGAPVGLGIPLALEDELRRGIAGLDVVNAVSLLELRGYLAQTLLRDGDVMSMAHGLEVRVPFLDRRVVDFVAAISGETKLSRVRPKPLLLDAAGSGVTEEIWARPKQGFTFPWEQWLRGPLKSMGDEAFTDDRTYQNLGLDIRAARRLWDAFQAQRPGVSWSRVWTLIALRDWAVRHGASA